MRTTRRKKVALNPARAKRMRELGALMALGKLYEEGMAWLEVVQALSDFAELLEGKPKKKGAPRRRYKQEENFLHLSCLYFHEQTASWQEKKGRPEADRNVASLTGWKVPTPWAK